MQYMKGVKRIIREWVFPTLCTVVAPLYSSMSVVLLNSIAITETQCRCIAITILKCNSLRLRTLSIPWSFYLLQMKERKGAGYEIQL